MTAASTLEPQEQFQCNYRSHAKMWPAYPIPKVPLLKAHGVYFQVNMHKIELAIAQ